MQAIELNTAQCDLCSATDTSVVYNNDNAWFPVLACNSFASNGTVSSEWDGEKYVPACDGINHKLDPFDKQSGVDCYWWYQGNYKNGWVYWMGDWRCGPCTVKTIIGPRS